MKGNREEVGMFEAVAPGVGRLGILFVNVFALGEPVGEPGRPWMLVDTGLAGSAGLIRRAVAGLFGEGARPEGILLTHGHFDHAGAARVLAEGWDVRIFAHPLEAPYLTGTLGLGLSIAGIGIVFREGLEADGAGLAGDLSVLLAAVGFGAYTVLSMRTLGRYSPLAVATYPTLFGAPVVLVVSVPVLLGTRWEGVEADAWVAVAFSAVFATAFAFAAWQRGVSRI